MANETPTQLEEEPAQTATLDEEDSADTVSVIDTKTNTKIATIPVGDDP